jgi:thioredoxin reductase (NADPH)
MNHYFTDIAIIGAGPVGLFAVFEAGMLKMKCHVIDTLEEVGGQCRALYPEKPIYDIPAYPSIAAEDLILNLEKQIAPFHPTFHLGQRVEKLSQDTDGNFTLTTSRGIQIKAKAVIIAAGCGAFGPNRPPLENIEQFESTSVFYLVKQKENFRDKIITIAGGGDSAVDWALSLADIAKHIYLVHRRNKFKCAPDSLSKLHQLAEKGKIELIVPYQLAAIHGENRILTAISVRDLDGNIRVLNCDILLPFFGLSMELGPILDWGLSLNRHHLEVNPTTLETNISGIYAIGDIASYPGKLKLILNGFAEAAMAAHSIYPKVHPNEALHFEYSTTKGIHSL